MNKSKIGRAIIKYDRKGNVTEAKFKGSFETSFDDSLKQQLIKASSRDEIKQNADLTLAGWFSSLNDIELADRNTHEIVSEVVSCDVYLFGKGVKKCIIDYYFQEKI